MMLFNDQLLVMLVLGIPAIILGLIIYFDIDVLSLFRFNQQNNFTCNNQSNSKNTSNG